MERLKLTDRYLRSLKPSADGKPYEIMDTVVDRMGVKVTGDNDKTLYLYTRFPETDPAKPARTLKKGAGGASWASTSKTSPGSASQPTMNC